MRAHDPTLHAVLLAAQVLLERHEDDMVTSAEWEALKAAVDAAKQPRPHERQEDFTIEDGCLIRRVVPKRGQPYEHMCQLDSYEIIADAIDDLAGAAFGIDDLRAGTNLPWTQIAVAMSFLKERGCVIPARGKKQRAADDSIYADALLEFHALREVEQQ